MFTNHSITCKFTHIRETSGEQFFTLLIYSILEVKFHLHFEYFPYYCKSMFDATVNHLYFVGILISWAVNMKIAKICGGKIQFEKSNSVA